MTDTERNAEILRKFSEGKSINDIWLTPLCPLDKAEIENLIRAELARRADALLEAQDLVMELFTQAYGIILSSGKHGYDHGCESTGEWAQRYLIQIGRIRPEECVRK